MRNDLPGTRAAEGKHVLSPSMYAINQHFIAPHPKPHLNGSFGRCGISPYSGFTVPGFGRYHSCL